MVSTILDPFGIWRELIRGIRLGLEQASRGGEGVMYSVTIRCHCGHTYEQSRPTHYAGAAAYPQHCPKCWK